MTPISSEQIVLDSLFEAFCKDEYPGENPDDVFEAFGATQVLKPHQLSAPELAAGIVDGEKDGGLDSFYVFMNGTLLSADDPILIDGDPSVRSIGANPKIDVFLIQSKNKTSWEESVWEKLLSSLPNLLRLDANPLHLEERIEQTWLRGLESSARLRGLFAPNFPRLAFAPSTLQKDLKVISLQQSPHAQSK